MKRVVETEEEVNEGVQDFFLFHMQAQYLNH